MSALETMEQAAEKVATGEWSPERWGEWYGAHQDAIAAEQQAARLLITPHVLRAPKRKPGRMSGPRYFNLMRAIENNPEQYVDYRPTTYCGAERTTEDMTRRDALSWLRKDPIAVAERGVCTACLDAAQADVPASR